MIPTIRLTLNNVEQYKIVSVIQNLETVMKLQLTKLCESVSNHKYTLCNMLPHERKQPPEKGFTQGQEESRKGSSFVAVEEDGGGGDNFCSCFLVVEEGGLYWTRLDEE